MATELKDTLNLPQTEFPMRASLVQREPERLRHWDKMSLYQKVLEKNRSEKGNGETFVLHDGPPFTSGDVHIGTALNKVIKDAIVRFKSMQGYAAPYVPGFDSHGLPIEHKVMVQMQEAGKDLSPLEVRKACAEFAEKYKERQSTQFQRLGVLGDWENPYWTILPEYEAVELEALADIVEQDLVYRSKKPIYWSIPCATALAEAEIEYKNHKSPSIYVAFDLPAEEAGKLGLEGTLKVVIWTSTPWTLPANLAIALHPEVQYAVVNHQGERYLLAEPRARELIELFQWEDARVEQTLAGAKFENLKARHPFIERDSLLVLADYVTTETGTGCVHTAPGHGLDDYLTGLKYGLEIYAPVNDEGKFLDDGRVPPDLVGLSLLEIKGRSEANKGVLQIIEGNGSLLHFETYEHQYPHCWRSKTPVIFRAMDQWFIALNKNDLRKKALAEIDKLAKNDGFIPAWGEKRIRGAIETRPDWCISRQRSWGVPIPAFYNKQGEPLLHASVIRGIAEKVREHGTDIWFDWDCQKLLEGIELPEDWPAVGDLTQGRDTLDVWIDSACSQNAVLEQHPDLKRPCEVYFEGSDQHRGWFQSTLWVGIMTRGNAPYQKLVTHGFMVNEDRTKISKSDGSKSKPQTSDSYIEQFGADVIRLWLCSQDFRGDVPVSEKIIKNIVNAYRSIRNTFRWQLGTLYDFPRDPDPLDPATLTPLDQWALCRTNRLIREVTEAFERFEFHRGYNAIINFITVTLSSTYHDILKDRLYTLAPDHPHRRSAQAVIREIFLTLVRLLAPVCPFTCDEAWSYFLEDSDFTDNGIALQEWPRVQDSWEQSETEAELSALLKFRTEFVNDKLEQLRQDKKIGKELDAAVRLTTPETHALYQSLNRHKEMLAELFQVSEVTLESTPPTPAAEGPEEISVNALPAESLGYEKCPRSWRWVPELVETDFGRVSPRDAEALENKEPLTS